jgi:outer membrane protein assembly factor BamB
MTSVKSTPEHLTPDCGPNAWQAQAWSERAYRWQGAALSQAWEFATDWKPPPNGQTFGGWEPVFHPALMGANASLVAVPGSGGTLHLLDRQSGALVRTVNPFGRSAPDADTFVAGPVAADAQGNAWYTAVHLDPNDPWGEQGTGADAQGFLVEVRPDGTFRTATYASLVPDAPQPGDRCEYHFVVSQPGPWPPLGAAGNPLPTPTVRCGAQRPQINAAPAIAADGTVFVVSRAHGSARAAYVVAVNPDLTPRWATSLRGRLDDGCGVTQPYGTDPLCCRPGTPPGYDFATNAPPAAQAVDEATSSPVALPDGGVLYGSYSGYNNGRGHLFRLDSTGAVAAVFDFGWDITPAVFPHGGTYSIVLKDNHYVDGPYFITQLDPQLRVEWQLASTETLSCTRTSAGVSCVDDGKHLGGFEWCVNAVAVDRDGVVYANSEDGNLYAIAPGGTVRQRYFLNLALGAAYTPLSIDAKGRIYTQNNGMLFVVGTN